MLQRRAVDHYDFAHASLSLSAIVLACMHHSCHPAYRVLPAGSAAAAASAGASMPPADNVDKSTGHAAAGEQDGPSLGVKMRHEATCLQSFYCTADVPDRRTQIHRPGAPRPVVPAAVTLTHLLPHAGRGLPVKLPPATKPFVRPPGKDQQPTGLHGQSQGPPPPPRRRALLQLDELDQGGGLTTPCLLSRLCWVASFCHAKDFKNGTSPVRQGHTLQLAIPRHKQMPVRHACAQPYPVSV